ncbi:MAG: hypothetical protein K8S94_02620 [Planctomycetia bacterium]|nr:hypothetical protein [Planctomycetia bacterium]
MKPFRESFRGGPRPRRAVVAVLCLALVQGAARAAAADPAGFRRLAPGVLTVIPPDRTADDTLLRTDLLEITKGQADLEWTPKMAASNTTFVARARGREYPRDIWCLEFAFKPPRMLDVDVPAADLRMRRKQIWYLLYRVKNVGGRRLVMGKGEQGDADPATRETESFEKPVRFLPHFVLESLEPVEDGEGSSFYRGYLDRLVPSAMDAIRRREDPQRRLFDSTEMSASDMAPGEERWGVAIWEDVDPRIDFFSIYVSGLTNAIRWRQKPGSVVKSDDPPGSDIEAILESLRLDFWRPGDARDGGDREMSVGFAGMFERMTLGGRMLSAIGWPGYSKSQPVAGLDALGLGWSDLLEPDVGGGAASLRPLEVVLRAAAGVKPPTDPIVVLRQVFGDLGVVAIEELAAAAAGPADAAQDQKRRTALEAVGLTPEAVAKKPLESLAKVVRMLEEKPDVDARRGAAADVFGVASRRIEWLNDAVAKARALATLRTIDADLTAIGGGDALAALEALRPAFEGLDAAEVKRVAEGLSTKTAESKARKEKLLELEDEARPKALADLILGGLFGARGPDLYAAAVAMHEGIDHAWVFRYEKDYPGL